jgi:hypothetical protein
MAVAHDAFSNSGTAASASVAAFSWTHTPVGTPKGVGVWVFTCNGTADLVTSVTYGGVNVPAVTGGRAVDSAGETGCCEFFFLGSGLPTGAQTIVVNRSNNGNFIGASAVTVTAGADTELTGAPVLITADTANPAATVGTAGVQSQGYVGTRYGGSSSTAGAGCTLLNSTRPSNSTGVSWATARETTSPGATGTKSVGFTHALDDQAFVAIAIREVAGGGGTTPTRGNASWAELETPNALTRGQVSFAELETPQVVTRGHVAWAELEVPQAATRGQVSLAELETPSVNATPTRGQVSFAELENSQVVTGGQVAWAELETPNALTRGRTTWVELEVPQAITRGRIAFAELEVPQALTRGRIAWAEVEVPSPPVATRGQFSAASLEVPGGGARTSRATLLGCG